MEKEAMRREAQTEEICLPPTLRKPRPRRWEASEYLQLVHGITVAPATLAKLASIGGGPSFHKALRTPLYPRAELDRWAQERLGKLPQHQRIGGVVMAVGDILRLFAPTRQPAGYLDFDGINRTALLALPDLLARWLRPSAGRRMGGNQPAARRQPPRQLPRQPHHRQMGRPLFLGGVRWTAFPFLPKSMTVRPRAAPACGGKLSASTSSLRHAISRYSWRSAGTGIFAQASCRRLSAGPPQPVSRRPVSRWPISRPAGTAMAVRPCVRLPCRLRTL